MSRTWLNDLKLNQLHRLATLVGSPCSGTKPIRIQGIQKAVRSAFTLEGSSHAKHGELRIISIDMGIRNLAFCSINTTFTHGSAGGPKIVKLEAWQRFELAHSKPVEPIARYKGLKASEENSNETIVKAKESFEPEVYAEHAYNFIKTMIDVHRPSHVLIERQRFRSGGGAAVQEWTIRVGLFEAMLYATLRTLVEQDYCDCTVIPVLPAMVNRFWLNGAVENTVEMKAEQKHSDSIKKRKIQIAGEVLSAALVDTAPFSLSNAASKTKDDYTAKLNKRKSPRADSIPKLDDLADCLLQGFAWILWQKNRLDLKALAAREFDIR